jgi:hypothetical protein
MWSGLCAATALSPPNGRRDNLCSLLLNAAEQKQKVAKEAREWASIFFRANGAIHH